MKKGLLTIFICLVAIIILIIVVNFSKSKNDIYNNTISGEENLNEINYPNDKTVMNIIEKYLALEGDLVYNVEGCLIELELFKSSKDIEYISEKASGEEQYFKVNIPYDTFKEEMLKYMSEKRFKMICVDKEIYKESEDGYLLMLPLGATGYTYRAKSVEFLGKEEDIYTYRAVLSLEMINTIYECTYDFNFKMINDNFVIDTYYIVDQEEKFSYELLSQFNWKPVKAYTSGDMEVDLSQVYGEDFKLSNENYLIFNEDKMFSSCVVIINGEDSYEGSYEIKDNQVVLEYNNEELETIEVLNIDGRIYLLRNVGEYIVYFERENI